MNEATTSLPRAAKEIKLTAAEEERFWSKVNKDGPTMPHMESPCWLWTAGKNKSGYGIVGLGGKSTLAHRATWLLINGPIPHDGSAHGICVCHRCDRRDCCRVDHLFLGTNADNVADRDAKGRNNQPSGDAHGSRLHPERLARGDRNGSRLYPERLSRGDKHYSRTRPECLARGDANGSRRHPESRPRGDGHAGAKLTSSQVIEIRTIYAAGEINQKQLSKRFKVGTSVINAIIHRKIWKHVP